MKMPDNPMPMFMQMNYRLNEHDWYPAAGSYAKFWPNGNNKIVDGYAEFLKTLMIKA